MHQKHFPQDERDAPQLASPAIFPCFRAGRLSAYDEIVRISMAMRTKSNHRAPIPNHLRRYRKARGLSQRDAARILGFADASCISRWEQGVCLPSPRNLFRLASLYRTLVDGLYIDLLRALREEIRRREAAHFHYDDQKA
jgi:DNA-binding transcriptional regulator YiaG